MTLREAKTIIEDWRQHYNRVRPKLTFEVDHLVQAPHFPSG